MRALPLFALTACSVTSVAPVDLTLPHDRHGHRAHVITDHLVVFGGFGASARGDRGTRETWIRDRSSGTWRRAADLVVPKSFGASAVVNGTPYALGDDIERYDVEADRWEVVAAVGSVQKSHFAAAAVGSRIYAVGGYPVDRGGVRVFDTQTRRVTEVPPPPGFGPGDHFHFVANLGERLHVIGGLDGDEFTPKREHWVLLDGAWRAATPPPDALWAKFAIHAVAGDRLFVFTGIGPQRGDALGPRRGLCYDPHADRWSELAAAPAALVMAATVVIDDRIHVLGGARLDEAPVTIPRVFDIATGRWTEARR